MRHDPPLVLGERVYISLIFLGFSTSFPGKPCASLAVVSVALLWPGAPDFLSPELAVGFLREGWDHPSTVPADLGVLGAPAARGFSRSVGS